jgi:hypothetical protein
MIKPSSYFLQVHENHELTDDDPKYEGNLPHLNVELRPHQKTTLHKMITKEKYLKSRTSSLTNTYIDYDHYFPNDYLNINSNMGFLANTVGSGKTFIILGLISQSKQINTKNTNWSYNLELLYHTTTFPKDVCSVIAEYHNDNNVEFNYNKTIMGENVIDNTEYNIIDTNLIVTPHSLITQWKNEIKQHTTFNLLVINNVRDLRKINQQENKQEYFNSFDIILCNANKYNNLMEIQDELLIKWQRVFFDEADTIKISNTRLCITNFLWLVTATFERFQDRGQIGFLSNINRGIDYFFFDKQVTELTNSFRIPYGRKNKIILNALTIKCNENYIKRNLIVQHPNYNNVFIENTPPIIRFIISLECIERSFKQCFLNNKSRFVENCTNIILDGKQFLEELEFPNILLRDINNFIKNNHFSSYDAHRRYRFRVLCNIMNIINYDDFISLYKNISGIENNNMFKRLILSYTVKILKEQAKLVKYVYIIEENKFKTRRIVNKTIDSILQHLKELNKIIKYINDNKICIICEKNDYQDDMEMITDDFCNFHYHFSCHIQDSQLINDYIIPNHSDTIMYRRHGYLISNHSFFANTEYNIRKKYTLHPFTINFSKVMSYIDSFNTNIYNETVFRQFFHNKLQEFTHENIDMYENTFSYLLKDSFFNTLNTNNDNIENITTYSFVEDKINYVKDRYINAENKKILFFSDSELIFNKIKQFLNDNNVNWGTISGNNKTIAKRLRDYTTGDLNVLLLNNNFFASGINLQNTTDIIILNYIDEHTMTQVIGRAQRIGRDINNRLNVNYILFESENYE